MFNLFKKKEQPALKFRFNESENTPCFVCDHVLDKLRPILYASHDKEDGSWQFLCGLDDHAASNAKMVSLKNATDIDPTINDLFEMPLGVGAVRETVASEWKPFRINYDLE
jgi:hypothetical protein